MKKEKMQEIEGKLKEQTKGTSIVEGSCYNVSDGLGLRYITPYALALGANNIIIAFLNSLPQLLGNLSQLYTTKLMEKVTRKKITFYGALLQALMWLPMILLGILYFIFKVNVSIYLIFVYTLLVLFGAFYGPAWNSWMRDIVDKERGKYFGMRNLICGAVALISMLFASFILDHFKKINLLYGFAIIFSLAFFSRFASAMLFRKKYEPPLKLEKGYYFSFIQFLKKMSSNNFGKFVIFFSLIQLAVSIASPFFAVYMLKELHFTYLFYILVVISSSFTTILMMPFWGRFVDRFGNLTTIKLCGFFVPLIPLMWFASFLLRGNEFTIFIYLFAVEAFSGMLWAGFNLASGIFIYDAVTKQRMALCIAYHSILSGVGVFLGAQLGGLLSSFGIIIAGSSFLFIFLLSTIARFVVYTIMISQIKEVRDTKQFDIKEAKEFFLASIHLNILTKSRAI